MRWPFGGCSFGVLFTRYLGYMPLALLALCPARVVASELGGLANLSRLTVYGGYALLFSSGSFSLGALFVYLMVAILSH